MSRTEAPLRYGYCDSPLGALLIASDADAVRVIRFPTEVASGGPPPDWRRDDAAFAEAHRQLQAYFAGELTEFDLPLDFAGTGFQNAVWAALCGIPFGRTTSYGALAATIGRPNASRAVGRANGANPLPIVVPCHRVIGADNSLTGFGGGVEIKRWLLDHERRLTQAANGQPELRL